VRQLDAHVTIARAEVGKLAEKFEQIRNETDISPRLKRLEELRTDLLARFPIKDTAANRFNDQFHTCDRDAAAAWEDLKAKRRELAAAHSKFDDLPIESESNDAHAKQLAKLEESEIPDYRTKAERERKNWELLFRTQVLEKGTMTLRVGRGCARSEWRGESVTRSDRRRRELGFDSPVAAARLAIPNGAVKRAVFF
jgi:hypothetical protein